MSNPLHKERHILLHGHLDELFADYIVHHPDKHGFLDTSIHDLIKWAADEAVNPTELPEEPDAKTH